VVFALHTSTSTATLSHHSYLNNTRAESALLWTQYFKLELLYVNKLRGRRLALGLEKAARSPDDPEDNEGEEEEGPCPVEVPALAEEDDGDAGPPAVPELDPSDPRAQSVQAVLEGAVPRVVYAAAVAARPHDLQLRLDCLVTLASLPGSEDGHFEPLAQEMLAGIERDVGPEAGAWARALHALRIGPSAAAAGEEEKEKSSKKGSSKKRPRAAAEEDGESAAWASGLPAPQAACLAALERGVTHAAPSSRRMWGYYLQGLTELLEAPPAVVAAALARADAALEGGEGLTPEMYLQWAEAYGSSSEGNGSKARGVLDKALNAHKGEPRLWAERLRLAAQGEEKEKGVQALWARALAAVGGAAAGVAGEAERRRAVADMWLVYLQRLLGKVEAAAGSDGSDSDSDDSEAEGGGDKVTRAMVERALESALVGTRGLGRVEVCALWARWQGRTGLRRALRLVGGVALDDDKAEAEAAVGALAGICVAVVAEGEGKGEPQQAPDFYEAALAVCGAHPAAKPVWDAYEAAERAAGQHQRAHGVRWRAAQALGSGGEPQQ
jgi:hypothetical protein